jgi:hypothetical protein
MKPYRFKPHPNAAPPRPTAGHRVASRGQGNTAGDSGRPRVLRAGETFEEVQLRSSIYALNRRLRESK